MVAPTLLEVLFWSLLGYQLAVLEETWSCKVVKAYLRLLEALLLPRAARQWEWVALWYWRVAEVSTCLAAVHLFPVHHLQAVLRAAM